MIKGMMCVNNVPPETTFTATMEVAKALGMVGYYSGKGKLTPNPLPNGHRVDACAIDLNTRDLILFGTWEDKFINVVIKGIILPGNGRDEDVVGRFLESKVGKTVEVEFRFEPF